jgi:hypothetical protein
MLAFLPNPDPAPVIITVFVMVDTVGDEVRLHRKFGAAPATMSA